MNLARLLLTAGLVIAPFGVAWAHASERGFILLLPTHLYIISGGLVVALSFVVMALIPRLGPRAVEMVRWRLLAPPHLSAVGPSLVAAAFVVALVVAGYIGSRDPMDNPLPQVIWGLWWVGFIFAHALFGNLWAYVNPWLGPYRLLTMLPGLRAWRRSPPLRYPESLGYWPAIVLLLAFAWLELIHPAPMEPTLLSGAAIVYSALTMLGMLLFGEKAWLRQGETFSIYFRIVSWLSPFDLGQKQPNRTGDSRVHLLAILPGAKLLQVGAVPLSGAAFVLLALAAVSFDGLSKTFWWLSLIGENPLEHPGRTVLMGVNSLGFLATFGALVTAYLLAVLLGRALGGYKLSRAETIGRFVISIIPIAFAYHFAHYLPAFLINVQYAVRTISDPFDLDWNLLGTRDLHITTSMLSNYDSVQAIWNIQAVAIIVAHVVAVAVAHVLALRSTANLRTAMLSQLPMTIMMIAYTVFGLWLLATPTAG